MGWKRRASPAFGAEINMALQRDMNYNNGTDDECLMSFCRKTEQNICHFLPYYYFIYDLYLIQKFYNIVLCCITFGLFSMLLIFAQVDIHWLKA